MYIIGVWAPALKSGLIQFDLIKPKNKRITIKTRWHETRLRHISHKWMIWIYRLNYNSDPSNQRKRIFNSIIVIVEGWMLPLHITFRSNEKPKPLHGFTKFKPPRDVLHITFLSNKNKNLCTDFTTIKNLRWSAERAAVAVL